MGLAGVGCVCSLLVWTPSVSLSLSPTVKVSLDQDRSVRVLFDGQTTLQLEPEGGPTVWMISTAFSRPTDSTQRNTTPCMARQFFFFSFAGDKTGRPVVVMNEAVLPQIAYGPVQLALHCCCLWPEVPSPQPLMVQAVLQDMLC